MTTLSPPTLCTCPATDPQAIEEALERDGCVVVSDLFPTRMIDQIREDIEAALSRVAWCNTADEGYGATFFGRNTKRLHGVLQYSKQLRDCMLHPLPLHIARQRLGCQPQFSTGEVMAIGPGEVQQALHTDAGSWRKANLPGELLFSMTMALTPFTASNGATVVAPGSHQWAADRKPQDQDFVAAEMDPGSAFFYSGQLLHSGGANQTDQTRVGLYFGYIPFWLQPLENPVVTHPPGFMDTLDEETQKFLGYSPAGFNALLG